MITAEQVSELQRGDVVRYTGHPALNGATVEGPLYVGSRSELFVGAEYVVRMQDGAPFTNHDIALAIVSRAPRPLFTNHSRAEPIEGDVVRLADDDTRSRVWFYMQGAATPGWYDRAGRRIDGRPGDGRALRMLVDGETGLPPVETP